ncbi:MAG TPA: portal protein, partial [Fibrobacteria bacterium]|nr:portal protein [Fibrobacteria bacterium]
ASDPGPALGATVEKLLELDEPRQARIEKYYRLYGGSRLLGIRPWEEPTDLKPFEREQSDALRLNVILAVIDTLCSKVGKLRARPTFLTNGGNWDLKLKAKRLQKFMDGAYHQSDTYEISPEAFRDACWSGTGIMHPYGAGKRICNERVPSHEFVVDPRDAMYGKPRRLYRVKWVSRECVAEEWGDDVLAESGSEAPELNTDDTPGREGYVRVIEAWHLPSPDYVYDEDVAEAMDMPEGCGRHVLQVGEATIEDEAWHAPEFPFVFIRFRKAAQGFWGDSIIKDLVGIQVEINKLLQVIQQAMQLVGQPMVLKRDGTVLSPERPTNAIGQVYNIDSTAPSLSEAIQVVAPAPMNSQVFQHVWALYDKAFEIAGINSLSASATAPAGMESARGLERLSDAQSDRFMELSRHFEYSVGEALARQFIRVAKELDESLEGGFSIRAPGERKASEDLRWKDVAIDEDGYLIQVFPTSILPTEPSARMDEVQRMTDAQWVSPDEARKLVDLPDLESSNDYATADLDNLERQLCDMLEHGKDILPEPYQDLGRALKMSQQALLRAKAEGAPDRSLDRVRNFITAIEVMMPPPAPPPAPPGAPPPGA